MAISEAGWSLAPGEGLLQTPRQVLADIAKLSSQQLTTSVWMLVKSHSSSLPGRRTQGPQKSATLFNDITVRRLSAPNIRNDISHSLSEMPEGTYRAQLVRPKTDAPASSSDIEVGANDKTYRFSLIDPYWTFQNGGCESKVLKAGNLKLAYGNGVPSQYFLKNILGVPNLISHVSVYQAEDGFKTIRLFIGRGKLVRFQVHRARIAA